MLVDTCGIQAMTDSREKNHARAVAEFETATQYVTHHYVMAEWVALATNRGRPRAEVLGVMDDLAADPRGEVVHVDRKLHDEAVSLLRARLDKDWSLCDAVSFILMTRLGVTEALTADHHFTQAGFRRLLG